VKKLSRLTACCLALVATCRARAPSEGIPLDVHRSLPVYLVPFEQSEVAGEVVNLGTFATGLVYLRLLEVPSLTVHQVSKEQVPECSNPSLLRRSMPQQQALPSQSAPVATTPSGDFYVVRGSVQVPLPEGVLDYSIQKCEDQKLKIIFKDTEPFTLDHAFEELTVAAHAVAYKLEQAVPPAQVALKRIDVEGDTHDAKEVDRLLGSIAQEMTAAISKSRDLAIAPDGEYQIGGHVTLEKGSGALHLFDKGTIRADLDVAVHGKKYPLKEITSPRNDPAGLSKELAKEVQNILPEVLLAEHLGLDQVQERMKSEKLRQVAGNLLDQCEKGPRTCESAGEAVRLLQTVTKNDGASWRNWWLLGRAELLAGRSADAALSLERANVLIKEDVAAGKAAEGDEPQVLNLLGDANRNIAQYDQAVTIYEESLRIQPSQPEVCTSTAFALELNGKRGVALATLIHGLQVGGPDAAKQSLHESAQGVIRALEPGEFDQAEALLSQAGKEAANEYALLLCRKWEQILDTSSTPENRSLARASLGKALEAKPSDPDILAEVYANLAVAQLVDGDRKKLELDLAEAEKLPDTQVSIAHREWLQRIRASDQMAHREYEKALESAQAARRIQETDDASLQMATAVVLLTEERKNVNVTDLKALRELNRTAADLATPLVDKRYAGADNVLVMANHFLNQDGKTRERFERIVKQDPKDLSGWNALMFVCSQYLEDAACTFSAAQKAVLLLDPNGVDVAGDYLNVAEAAVLARKDEAAGQWLGMAQNRDRTDARVQSLVHFYRLWLDFHQGHAGDGSTDFEAWQEAMQRFRGSNDDLNWVFTGMRKLVSKENISAPRKQLLEAMMDALENSQKPLPAWPGLDVM
jgi:tetratricopeptide (TPR) repeat protein